MKVRKKSQKKRVKLMDFAYELKLPLDTATLTLGHLGKKGGGKTYGAQKLFELLHAAGVQCVALDPVGNWWSLRVGKNGKSPGLKVYVFGGPRGDVPIHPDAGAYVARVIVEKRISVILDVSRFRKAERKRFMTAFAEEFFHLKKDSVSPVHLFIEEAHKFIPQFVRDGEEQMLGAMEDIVRIGRNYGIGASLISQRSASVNKDVLSQVECLVAYQTSAKQDKKAIVDWVEENDDAGVVLLSELKSLQRGEALFWSPSELRVFKKIHVNQKETLDASSTPKVGGRKRKPIKLARVDLKGIEAAMQQVVQEAEASNVPALKKKVADQAKFIKALEERIIEMGKALGVKTMKPGKVKVEKEVVMMINPRQLRLVDRVSDKLLASQDRMNQAAQVVASELGNLKSMIQQGMKTIERQINQQYPRSVDSATSGHSKDINKPLTKVEAKEIVKVAKNREKPAKQSNGAVEVDGPMLKVLAGLAWFESIGMAEPPADALAFMSSYSGGDNGAFNNARGRLRSIGYVTYPSPGTTAFTTEGRAAAPAVEIPTTRAALHASVMAKLDGPEKRVLQPLIDAYPNEVDGDTLASDAKYSDADNGAFNNARGRLRTLGLVTYPRAKHTRAADILFPQQLEVVHEGKRSARGRSRRAN